MSGAVIMAGAVAVLCLWTYLVTRDFPWWTDSTDGSNTE